MHRSFITTTTVLALSLSAALLPAVTDAQSVSPLPSGAPASAAQGLTLVALGDSWPAGAHCGGCRTFMGRYADDLQEGSGRPVLFVDRTQAVIPRTTQGETPESLLADLRSDGALRDAVAGADVIVISNGLNDLDGGSLDAYLAGTCGGSDGADCFRALGPVWHDTFDAILTEVEAVRAGRPTAVRLVTAENIFISDPGLAADFGADFGPNQGKLIIDQLANAMCEVAAAHHAVCIDARPILNGPALDQPVDENTPESHQAIADALIASGLPELDR